MKTSFAPVNARLAVLNDSLATMDATIGLLDVALRDADPAIAKAIRHLQVMTNIMTDEVYNLGLMEFDPPFRDLFKLDVMEVEQSPREVM